MVNVLALALAAASFRSLCWFHCILAWHGVQPSCPRYSEWSDPNIPHAL